MNNHEVAVYRISLILQSIEIPETILAPVLNKFK